MTNRLGAYLLGPNDTPENGIYTGDCSRLLTDLPSDCIDLVLTDPPFGTGTTFADKLPDADAWIGMRNVGLSLFALFGYAKQLFAWAKYFNDLQLIGYIVWHKYNEVLVSPGLTRVHQDIAIWGHSQKQIYASRVREPRTAYHHDLARYYAGGHGTSAKSGLGSRLQKRAQAEPSKRKPHRLGRRCSDLWAIAAPGAGFNAHLRRHKNEKPEQVISRLLLLLTEPGAIVCDPYTGSGTIPAVCKQLGRRYLAFEILPTVAEAARQRVKDTQQPPMFVPSPEPEQLDLALPATT